ncbi:hypothetical protein M2T79_09225 [Elizabethkingia miricola]|uniref:hypothetical protein n=1 Tax=Elizabethkingia miricola TaxID=172045 RepID=UPI0020198AE5|nr:hypothetical protein [Elizabethkingia miricola]MCL1656779.1 hypothetical protein [Elizabethkingia miricola]
MIFKGTNGKWELESEAPSVFPVVNFKNEKRSLTIMIMLNDLEYKRQYYGNCYELVKNGSISKSIENIANAKLISKAPEIFSELKSSLLTIENTLAYMTAIKQHIPDWHMEKYNNAFNILQNQKDKNINIINESTK